MNTKILFAGMLLAGTTVTSSIALADDAPAICKSVANYAVQSLDRLFTDGTFEQKYNPPSETLHLNFNTYPISQIKDLGDCDSTTIEQSYCQVAGGPAEVYEIDFSRNEGRNGTYPLASVIVTFNRGGCRVDAAKLN